MSQIRLTHCTAKCTNTQLYTYTKHDPNGAKLCCKYAGHCKPPTTLHCIGVGVCHLLNSELQFSALFGHQMALCGAGQDSLVEHLGGGSNVKDVGGIPGSYFAFAGSLHRLVELGKTKDLLVFLSCDNSL